MEAKTVELLKNCHSYSPLPMNFPAVYERRALNVRRFEKVKSPVGYTRVSVPLVFIGAILS